jgi:hypothetical protein
VMVSYFENAGSRCFDLLADRGDVQIRVDGEGQVQLIGLTRVHVRSNEHLQEVLRAGARLRDTKPTATNPHSSRSHALCTLSLVEEEEVGRVGGGRWVERRSGGGGGERMGGSLTVVDLAGSERTKHARHHSRERVEEMKQINWSLGCLGQCIRDMYEKRNGDVVLFLPCCVVCVCVNRVCRSCVCVCVCVLYVTV